MSARRGAPRPTGAPEAVLRGARRRARPVRGRRPGRAPAAVPVGATPGGGGTIPRMAEIIQKDGTWAFDGDALRLTPGRDRNVGLLRRALGELAVPCARWRDIVRAGEEDRAVEAAAARRRRSAAPGHRGPARRTARPVSVDVESDRYGVAEYFVDEVRSALLLDQVPAGPVDRYLLPGPAVPMSVSAGDGTASFDGEQVRLEWNWKTEDAKAAAGPRVLARSPTWPPWSGIPRPVWRTAACASPCELRRQGPGEVRPERGGAVGLQKDPLMALVAAAVQARLPHPATPGAGPTRAGTDPERCPRSAAAAGARAGRGAAAAARAG